MDKCKTLIDNRDMPVNYDRKAFAEEFIKLLKTPGYSTRHKSEVTNKGKEEAMKKEVELSEADAALDELAANLTSALGAKSETFMLNTPLSLTVKKADGRFSKRPHVGGEDFAFERAYRGKRGKLIFAFKPVMVSEYVEMEMDTSNAFDALTGFKEFLQEHFGKLDDALGDINKMQADHKEAERLADRNEKYAALGFGSW